MTSELFLRHLKLQEEGIISPIIIGNKEEIPSTLTVINPQTYEEIDELVAAFVERRKGKVTEEQAREIYKMSIILGRC